MFSNLKFITHLKHLLPVLQYSVITKYIASERNTSRKFVHKREHNLIHQSYTINSTLHLEKTLPEYPHYQQYTLAWKDPSEYPHYQQYTLAWKDPSEYPHYQQYTFAWKDPPEHPHY